MNQNIMNRMVRIQLCSNFALALPRSSFSVFLFMLIFLNIFSHASYFLYLYFIHSYWIFSISKAPESMNREKLMKKINFKITIKIFFYIIIYKEKLLWNSIIAHRKHLSWLAETSWNYLCSFSSWVMVNNRSWKYISLVMIIHWILIHNNELYQI